MSISEINEEFTALDAEKSSHGVHHHVNEGGFRKKISFGDSFSQLSSEGDFDSSTSNSNMNRIQSAIILDGQNGKRRKLSIRWSDMELIKNKDKADDNHSNDNNYSLPSDVDLLRREESNDFNDSFFAKRRKRLVSPKKQAHKHGDHDLWQSPMSYMSSKASMSPFEATLEKSRAGYHGPLKAQRSIHNMVHPMEKHALNLKPLRTLLKKSPSKAFVNEFDCVIAFPYSEHDALGQSSDAKFIMHSMLLAGLELFPYISANKQSLFVLIRCPVSFLFFRTVIVFVGH